MHVSPSKPQQHVETITFLQFRSPGAVAWLVCRSIPGGGTWRGGTLHRHTLMAIKLLQHQTSQLVEVDDVFSCIFSRLTLRLCARSLSGFLEFSFTIQPLEHLTEGHESASIAIP